MKLDEQKLYRGLEMHVVIYRSRMWRVRKWLGLQCVKAGARLLNMSIHVDLQEPEYHETGGARMVECAIEEARKVYYNAAGHS